MTLGVCGVGPEVGAQATLGLTLSPCSLVCTALRGKLGVFSEMEANFKVCGPIQPLSHWHRQPPEHCPLRATLLMPEIDRQVALLLPLPACERGASS